MTNKRRYPEIPSDYVIEEVGWSLPENQPGSLHSIESLRVEYWTLFSFLQDEGLVKRVLVRSPDEIGPATQLVAGDLTEEGIQFIRTGYQQWLKALDRTEFPKRTEKAKSKVLLRKYLDQMRAGL